MKRLSSLIALFILVLPACELIFSNSFPDTISGYKWKLSYLKLKDKEVPELEEKSKELFEMMHSEYIFNDDGTYDAVTTVTLMGQEVTEESSGTWSFLESRGMFYLDGDTFNVMVINEERMELLCSQSVSDELLSEYYSEYLGNEVIMVFEPVEELVEEEEEVSGEEFRLIKKVLYNAKNEKVAEITYTYLRDRVATERFTRANGELAETLSYDYTYRGDSVWRENLTGSDIRFYIIKDGLMLQYGDFDSYSYTDGLLTQAKYYRKGVLNSYTKWSYSGTNPSASYSYDGSTNQLGGSSNYEYSSNQVIEYSYDANGKNTYRKYYEFKNGKRSAYYDYYYYNDQWFKAPDDECWIYEYNNDGLLYKLITGYGSTITSTGIYSYEKGVGNLDAFQLPYTRLLWTK